MRVFMLGWEFPPFISGGLGTACHGITKGLDEVGVEVCFVLPTAVPIDSSCDSVSDHVTLRTPADLLALGKSDDETPDDTRTAVECKLEHLTIHQLDAILQPYASEVDFEIEMLKTNRRARSEAAKKILRQVIIDNNHKGAGKKTDAQPATKKSKKDKAKTNLPNGTRRFIFMRTMDAK